MISSLLKTNTQARLIVTLIVFLTALFIARPSVAGAAKLQGTTVTVEEKTIQLPTYLLGPEDPNPPFQLVTAHAIYPYTMLDDLTDHRQMVGYKAFILENEYLRATILPELGARLYSLYDKVGKREVFYRNDSVKYGLVGLRGAWISGGIEFNFPNGHTTDTVSPVSSHYRKNADGSATVVVGDVDQVSEMYWQVELTLRPDTARLEQHVELFNPTPVEHLYWYWNNAAVQATEDMKFTYPMREVNPDSPSDNWTFPIWKEVDYSHYRNIRQPTELFGVHVHRTFFGAYYGKANYGVVHFANYRDVTGKKLWTWGVAGDGTIWTDLLTDANGPYNEIQAGRFETQLTQDFMPTQAVEAWTEYWYPVQKLDDGFVEASKQFAINVRFLPEAAPTGTFHIAVSPTETIHDVSLSVELDGKIVKQFTHLSFEPLNTKAFDVLVDDLEAAKRGAIVDIVANSGATLLHWSAADPIDGNSDTAAKAETTPVHRTDEGDLGVEELFLQGELKEREGDAAAAGHIFEETLKRDPTYISVLRKLAIRHYSDADLATAQLYIERALRQNESDAETQYDAGIIYEAAGKTAYAQDAFSTSVRLGRSPSSALLRLGEIALSSKDYARAEDLFRKALTYEPDDTLELSDLAVALRLNHKLSDATKVAADAVDTMSLYPVALAEQWRNAAMTDGDANAVQAAKKTWMKAVGDRMQSYLEAGSWYWRLQDFPSSDFILTAACQHFSIDQISPLVYYYLASNARHEGQAQRAAEYAANARTARYQGIFPNRISDARVLEEALLANAADSHARYLLGDYLFQHGRYDEAYDQWLKAQSSGFDDPVLYRNLGIYAWKIEKDLSKAAGYYQKAIKLDPHGYRLYVDLDQIDAQAGGTDAREKLFSGAPPDVLDHDTARVRYCELLITKGRFDQALDLLKDHRFKPWELGEDVREIYVAANIQRGRQALAANNFKLAEENFLRALEYPVNLGIGKPDKPNDAAAHYWLGMALAQQGDKDGANREWNLLLNEAGGNTLSKYYEALALERVGKKKEAADEMNSLAEGPVEGRTGASNYFVAGLAKRHQGQRQQASAYFQMATEINPSFWRTENEFDK